nr:MAG TPA: hypothetical protein [Caudoviricetes sp.]
MANYCYYSYKTISPVNFSELPFREVGFLLPIRISRTSCSYYNSSFANCQA